MAKKKGWLNRNVFLFGLASLFSDMSHEMATAILPIFLSVELKSAAAILGIIEGISDFSSSFIKTFAGWFSDKLGKRKPFVIIGYIMTGFFIPLIGFATHWVHVLIARTFGWIGKGMRSPARDALLTESVDKETRSKSFGFERMMDMLGAILGPGIAFLMLTLIGIRNVFFLSFIPGLFSIFSVVFVKEKYIKKNNKIDFLKTLKNMPVEFKKFLIAAFVFGIGNFANTFLVLRVMEALKPNLGIIVAGSISTGLYVFLNFGAAIFAYVFGNLGDILDKKLLLGLGYLIFAIYCLGFVFLPSTLISFLILFLLAGVETGLIDVMERAYAADLLTKNIRGTGFGLLNTINGIGDFVSSIIAGFLWTLLSYKGSFIYGAIFSILATIILFLNKKNSVKGMKNV
ncbi:MAG: MFS transporter [Candidatus Woesearchaeota archaeon]